MLGRARLWLHSRNESFCQGFGFQYVQSSASNRRTDERANAFLRIEACMATPFPEPFYGAKVFSEDSCRYAVRLDRRVHVHDLHR